MNKLTLGGLAILYTGIVLAGKPADPKGTELKQKSQTITFTENKGQVGDQYYQPRPDVLYSGMANGMAYHLKATGISYQLNRVDSWKEETDPKFHEKRKVSDQVSVYRLDINWLNANKNVKTIASGPLPGFSNYYLSVCPDGVLGVKSYADILYRDIYENIDLHYYGSGGSLKYDFIVAPGGDHKRIQLEIKGAESIAMNADGSISLKTPFGIVEEGAPLVYQQGKKLAARWTVRGNTLGFEVDGVNPALPLLIDPLTRSWGTWYGGTGDDYGGGVASDDLGNGYMTGQTSTAAFSAIATLGAHQSTLGGGGRDAFLVKFDKDGVRQWGTYYGGNSSDGGSACVVNEFSEVYMTGSSSSTDNNVMATPAAHQPSLGGSSYYWSDAILIKFSSSGARIWGTYYGGMSDDSGGDVGLDAQGNVYMVGSAKSGTSTVISTPGTHQPNYGGGNSNGGDGFVAKFSSGGIRQWGTYYGGGNEDFVNNCSVDASGNVYLVGSTASYNNISSSGAHQTAYGGGSSLYNYDAFAVKLNSNGARQWGTYYGGTGYDLGYGCTVDSNGNLYISGMSSTSVTGVMTTPGSYEPNFISSAGYAAFLAKFNPTGVRQWATFYSKGYWTEGRSCAVNSQDEVYVVGFTGANSSTALATPGGHQVMHGGGSYDGIMFRFSSSGARLEGSYYGGNGGENIGSCATSTMGYLYISGSSDNSPGTGVATPGSHQPNFAAMQDAFFAQFFECNTVPAPVSPTLSGTPLCEGNTATLSANTSTGTVNWYDASGTSLSTGPVYVTPTLSAGTYSWYAEAKTCTASPRTLITAVVDICAGIGVNQAAASFKLYPNPNNGAFTIELLQPANARIVNVLGQPVFTTQLAQGKNEIDLGNLAKGIYFVELGDGAARQVVKVIKE